MTEIRVTPISAKSRFYQAMTKNIERNRFDLDSVYDRDDPVSRRLIEEYGSIFVTKAIPPCALVFADEAAVSEFQTRVGFAEVEIAGVRIELQERAAKDLVSALAEASSNGMTITPRDEKDSARRTFDQTTKLWAGRVTTACEHWVSNGKLNTIKAEALQSMSPRKQIEAVLDLEDDGLFFSTFFDKSILYSVAAPGASQHLGMLALDIKEFEDQGVRAILARNGWFRTVISDLPHFTYLGHAKSDLKNLGLKAISTDDGEFWVPDI